MAATLTVSMHDRACRHGAPPKHGPRARRTQSGYALACARRCIGVWWRIRTVEIVPGARSECRDWPRMEQSFADVLSRLKSYAKALLLMTQASEPASVDVAPGHARVPMRAAQHTSVQASAHCGLWVACAAPPPTPAALSC